MFWEIFSVLSPLSPFPLPLFFPRRVYYCRVLYFGNAIEIEGGDLCMGGSTDIPTRFDLCMYVYIIVLLKFKGERRNRENPPRRDCNTVKAPHHSVEI